MDIDERKDSALEAEASCSSNAQLELERKQITEMTESQPKERDKIDNIPDHFTEASKRRIRASKRRIRAIVKPSVPLEEAKAYERTRYAKWKSEQMRLSPKQYHKRSRYDEHSSIHYIPTMRTTSRLDRTSVTSSRERVERQRSERMTPHSPEQSKKK